MLVLVTGATGKVGRRFIDAILADPRFAGARIRALCHNRLLPVTDRVEVLKGDISDRTVADAAIAGVSHVVHLATCKEIPETVMDVTVKGLFLLLEAFRASSSARQFVLVGGDAGVGHFFYRHDGPVTEQTRHRAYPGCYALSKVLEEVMLEQFGIQYGLRWCCLRAPWIMEKDDFRYSLSFGDDVFGGPDWKTLVAPSIADACRREQTIPLLRDVGQKPLKRNFVHIDDLVEAILLAIGVDARGLYNVSMDEPVDYGEVAAYLHKTRGLGSIDIPSEYHSTWMDNSKAKFDLAWRPRHDLERLIESAWNYRRGHGDTRKIWYPG